MEQQHDDGAVVGPGSCIESPYSGQPMAMMKTERNQSPQQSMHDEPAASTLANSTMMTNGAIKLEQQQKQQQQLLMANLWGNLLGLGHQHHQQMDPRLLEDNIAVSPYRIKEQLFPDWLL